MTRVKPIPKVSKKRKASEQAVRIQYGALPYRTDKAGEVLVLLVTTRRSRKWIVPKGWPIKGLTPKETAAREAYEEAGARGDMERRSLGTYRYDKFLDDREIAVPCEVKVFLLRVRRLERSWPEQQQRIVRWFALPDAVRAVSEIGLKDLIMRLAEIMAE